MRWVLAAAVLLAGCASTPPVERQADTTLPSWYPQALNQLTALNRGAEDDFQHGRSDDAAAKIKEAQPLAARLLGVPRPSFEAVEAASDVDDLYGRMLLANHNYGWAQMFFQKNRSRWKNWRPQTSESERRFKLAEAEIAECDRHIN
jgi:hypothetical protein